MIWPDGFHLATIVTFVGWLVLFVMAYGTRPRPSRPDVDLATVISFARTMPVVAQESRAA